MNLILSPNSSTTSKGVTGLILDDIFALGIARGNFIFLNKFFAIQCFGNLTAIVFKLPFAKAWCFIAFYICTLIVYWTGWEIVSKLGLCLFISFILFIMRI